MPSDAELAKLMKEDEVMPTSRGCRNWRELARRLLVCLVPFLVAGFFILTDFARRQQMPYVDLSQQWPRAYGIAAAHSWHLGVLLLVIAVIGLAAWVWLEVVGWKRAGQESDFVRRIDDAVARFEATASRLHTDTGAGSAGGSQDVARDTVYSEMYAEMRRFRDYELSSASWYTAMLLALLGGLFLYSTTEEPALTVDLVKTIAILLAAVLCAAGWFAVGYSWARYRELRDYTTAQLEPGWHRFTPKSHDWTPRHSIYVSQGILAVAVVILACHL